MVERMTPEGIQALRRKGMNQSQVAQYFGVSRQAVSDMVRRYGIQWVTPRVLVRKSFPWTVEDQFKNESPCKRLRDHAEYYATSGKGLQEFKLERLFSFYLKLRDENVVVEYNPDFPPSPGIGNGGWRYTEKLPTDNDLIVRLNELSLPLEEEDLKVWKFPKELPRIRRVD